MNIVGSVLGTPGKSNRYEVLPGQPYDDWSERVIYALGVGSGVEDPNVAATLLRHGNYDYVTNSVKWDPGIPDHDLPASLYRSGAPEWWCQETPWPAIGPDVAGYTNDIPAKRRFEGLPCTQTTEVTLTGAPADQTIYLSWEVTGILPVTSTWTIDYEGTAGSDPSPITGIPGESRAYALTGLENYTWYTVTLTTNPPLLVDSVRVMPTDLLLFMPLVAR